MQTNQKWILLVFVSGLGAFFYFGSEMLVKHTAWTEFQTPAGMADIFGLLASVTATVGAALGLDVANLVKRIKGD